MLKKLDNRSICSAEKKSKIKQTKMQTALRRAGQVVKVFECKIVEKRLNKKQREEFEMLFVEGKWFYNHVLSLKKSCGVRLQDVNTTKIKEVKHFDRDHQEIVSPLQHLSSQ